jgi:hypothetical protein
MAAHYVGCPSLSILSVNFTSNRKFYSMYELDRALQNDQDNAVSLIAQREFENLIQKGQYVGDV